jgi:ribonuclease HI
MLAAMTAAAPHFLLFSDADRRPGESECGDWRFVLQASDGSTRIEVKDAEPQTHGERLELLAVVRGLEALEQPSRVTLVTSSRYVSRGLTYGLRDWRDNNWQWERHGSMAPIKNHDLWRRLDRALDFHRVECRKLQGGQRKVDLRVAGVNRSVPQAAAPSESTKAEPEQNRKAEIDLPRRSAGARFALPKPPRVVRFIGELLDRCRLKLAQCGTALLPPPWLE